MILKLQGTGLGLCVLPMALLVLEPEGWQSPGADRTQGLRWEAGASGVLWEKGRAPGQWGRHPSVQRFGDWSTQRDWTLGAWVRCCCIPGWLDPLLGD